MQAAQTGRTISPPNLRQQTDNPMRTHYCGQVNESQIGEEISVCGWVHRRRDHGGVIFVDLRDREGLLQVVFDPDRPEIFAEAERIRGEYVLAVKGKVRPRPEGTVNPNMPTGAGTADGTVKLPCIWTVAFIKYISWKWRSNRSSNSSKP